MRKIQRIFQCVFAYAKVDGVFAGIRVGECVHSLSLSSSRICCNLDSPITEIARQVLGILSLCNIGISETSSEV